ncbi:MAG: SLC13 family permease [Rhodothalassiaceae bacterium]
MSVLLLFIWGRLRYDMVAFSALMACVLLGLVPADAAFDGFAHPAVVTVAAVLVISRGLQTSGAIDRIAEHVVPAKAGAQRQIGQMAGFAAGLSAFMNNVGALALLMPAAIDGAQKAGRSPSLLLMPLSFASILGGLITLIGTPPNIVISGFRADALGEPFRMFDFAPVGLAVLALGLPYLAFVGWRLLPAERRGRSAPDELFNIDEYVCELTVPDGNDWIGETLADLSSVAEKADARVAGIIRGRNKILLVQRRNRLRAGDILLLEADPGSLDRFAHASGFQISGEEKAGRSLLSSEATTLVEAVIAPDSRLVGRRVGSTRLRARYGLNLLGLSRQGQAIRKRLSSETFQTGDILLMQADPDAVYDTLQRLNMLPLAGRNIQFGRRDQAWLAVGLFGLAVALAAFGLLDLTLAMALAAFAMVAGQIVPVREVYDAIEWPVLVLIGAMIPVGQALETTGGTTLIADTLLDLSAGVPGWMILGLVLLVTMTLSDIMNNVATAVVMAPVSLAMAEGLNANPDAFLMAVALGASCAFLTPIGHKNNALVMGPGGYRFGDYWRVGLPLEAAILVVGLPAILVFWGL